ncbi:hypothetical protein VTN77DRAFT_2918 [Rasamsonia byssochlamydoides]|uniref:uncharacterized protein n=1 Tax=Rasamsonia byssochlamydoides TaxID=89139 RepID=UPI003743D00C
MDGEVDASNVHGKPRQKHSCSACARRKVKCDRQEPCTSCVKTKSECLYSAQTTLPRRRKRHDPQEDIFARHGWIHCRIEVDDRQTSSSTPVLSKEMRSGNRPSTGEKGEANWWAALSDEVRIQE